MRFLAACLRWAVAVSLLLALAACAGTGILPRAQQPAEYVAGPVGGAAGREQSWLVPSTVPGLLMRARVFRPTGTGPFPLAVVAHGSDQEAGVRARMGMPDFPALTDWLLARGYAVVLVQRPGHGATGGPYLEDQGSCSGADYVGAGRRTAASLEAAIAYFAGQSFIEGSSVVLLGNSAGGWGAIAAGADGVSGLTRIVNFAGGRGGHNRGRAGENCAADRLVDAAASFGAASRTPTLWLYAQNDSYFPPVLSRRMYEAFSSAGGAGTYVLLPSVGAEGHELVGSRATWEAALGDFLR